jgi:putative MFS transporter
VQVWFALGVLLRFSGTFALSSGVAGHVEPGNCIMWAYLGLSVGDLISGALSRWLQSRRRVVLIYLALTSGLTLACMLINGLSVEGFSALCFALGVAAGYWALFVTIAAEQFGTNIRATVTNTVPNFVRGSVIPLVFSFNYLEPRIGASMAALVVGAVSIALALVSTLVLDETYGKDLNYLEAH